MEKRTAHAAEQDRPDILTRRQAWFDGQPDLNPERLVMLRKAAERTVEGLWNAIGRFINQFAPQECANFFAAAGYDPS